MKSQIQTNKGKGTENLTPLYIPCSFDLLLFLIFRQIIKSGHKTFETNTGIIRHFYWTHMYLDSSRCCPLC